MKLQLCAPAVLQQLLAVISSQQSRQDDEDALASVKNASDLINTILTGGKIMSEVHFVRYILSNDVRVVLTRSK